ncbi:MAG: hypothetical protein L0Y56_02250 [Nitrospira sp.]|nr:hypothetical protein [Nitrospira sp.]
MATNDEGQLEGATTSESEGGTSISKFKSAEDRDKAYLELEQRSTVQAQELAEMKRQMEDFRSSVAQRTDSQEDQRQFTDVYKSQDQLKKFWERFASSPDEVFQEREQKLLNAWEQRQAIKDAARDAVAEFKIKHPDLAPYEEIVSVYVQRQPQNLTPRERLERAAPEARKMIAGIAQKGSSAGGQATDPATYVEAPSGSRQSVAKATPPVAESEEDILSEYIKERRAGGQR